MYKIGFDLTPLKTAHAARGIGKYTKELIEAINTLKIPDVEIIPLESGKFNLNLDLIHYPYFDLFSPSLPLRKNISTIVTIHDVIPLIFPQAYPPGIKGKIGNIYQKISLKTVKSIITDSNNSKKDIVKYLRIPESKIEVIYLAPSSIYQHLEKRDWEEEIRKKYQLPKVFVLYVGDVNWNKNLLALANACKSLNTPLVIVGKQAVGEKFDESHIENQPLVELLKKYGNDSKVRRLGYVSDEDLVKIYNLANVYCLPSLYEGFGLSVLEAMACGCPVVCSNTSSLPEIGQDAVRYFNPKNVGELKEILESVLKSDKIASELREKGYVQVKKFSWEKTAEETIAVYRKVLENIL